MAAGAARTGSSNRQPQTKTKLAPPQITALTPRSRQPPPACRARGRHARVPPKRRPHCACIASVRGHRYPRSVLASPAPDPAETCAFAADQRGRGGGVRRSPAGPRAGRGSIPPGSTSRSLAQSSTRAPRARSSTPVNAKTRPGAASTACARPSRFSARGGLGPSPLPDVSAAGSDGYGPGKAPRTSISGISLGDDAGASSQQRHRQHADLDIEAARSAAP
jgi:hypothetical protein